MDTSGLKSGIYVIQNTVTNKCYYGSSVNLWQRWLAHRHLLRRKKHPNIHLQRAWNLNGEASFLFAVVEQCPQEQLLVREQSFLDKWCGKAECYNISPIAGSTFGISRSAESRLKQSRSITGSKNHRFGIRHSDTTKLQISRAKQGSKHSLATCEKIANAHKKPVKNNETGDEYDSVQAAATALKLSPPSIRYRIQQGKFTYLPTCKSE